MKVSAVMTPDPFCCMRTARVIDAIKLMQQFDLGLLMVVDEGWTRKLVGVVTDRDICLSMLAEPHEPSLAKVENCMRTNLVTCSPETHLWQALAEMARHRIRRIPVVKEGKYLCGVIGISDLIRHEAVSPRDLWMALSRITEPRTERVRAKAA